MAESLTADRRSLRILLAAGLAMFLVYTDFFAVQVSLPDMANDLNTTVTNLQWVISGYMLSLASFLIVGGRLADILGRKTWLIIGVIIFAAASLAGGMSTSAEMIIGFRVIQGVGAAILMPVSVAVVTNAFPAAKVQRAVGVAIGIAAIGQATGPLIGGFLTEFISWRWVLWINVPVSALVLVLILTAVQQSYDESAGRSIDWTGLVLVVLSIGAFTYGIDKAADWGWNSPATLALTLGSLVGFGLFVWWENRNPQPLVDLGLFKNREFSVMTAAGAAGNMGIVVVIFLSVIYLQTEHGYSAIQAAFAFLILSAGMTASAQLAGRLESFKSWAVMTTSLIIGGLGAVAMGLLTGSVPLFLAASLFAGLGLGMTWAYANVVTQSIVPPAKAGSASGLVLTILIGLGGVATAAAASLTATGAGQGNSTSDVLGGVLIAFGALALICAPLVVLFGRQPSKSPAQVATTERANGVSQ
jgi:EmrB/QacA subfamily drug resistance transporter